MQVQYEGTSLNIQKILAQLFRQKLINFNILLLFILIGLLYYQYATPVYKTSATVEIKTPQTLQDRVLIDFEPDTNLQTDIDILKSDFMIKTTLQSLDILVDYYKYDNMKPKAIYRKSPFQISYFSVHNPTLYGRQFIIKDLGENRFRIKPKHSLKSKLLIWLGLKKEHPVFTGIYTYDKPIQTKEITLIIQKKHPFTKGTYGFAIQNPLDTVRETKKRLNVTPASLRSTILKLSYRDHSAKRAKDFLNTLIKNYLDYSIKDRISLERKKLDFVNEQLASIKSKLMLSENKMANFKVQNNIADLNLQVQEIVKKISQLKEALDETNLQYRTANWLVHEIKKGNYPVLNSIQDQYPALLEMTQTLQKLQEERIQLLGKFTKAHPDVIALNQSIYTLKKNIRKSAESLKKKIAQKRYAISHDLKLYQNLLKELPEKEKELARIKRVFDINDNVYNYLLKKQSELSLKNLTIFSNKKVLDYAHLPLRPVSPKLGMILAVNTFLALLAMLLYAIWKIKRDTVVKSAEDVVEVTDIPIYGMLPYVHNSTLYNKAYVMSDPGSTSAEAFRTIRTNLDYVATTSKSKIVLVTSSVPNEGKTVVASNLAAIIAMGEQKCILLSMDLRKPQIHHKFGLPNKAGMSEVLAGKEKIENVTWRHRTYHNLHIVTSGRIPPNPAELIASKRTAEILAKLRDSYDYIIIDTPPVQYVSDAISLFRHSDINLFVVKSEFTDKKYLVHLDAMVKKLKLQHSGIILNSVKKEYQDKKYFDKKYIFYEYL